MFENCKNTKDRGDVGEARAIYEFTKMGYTVCKPLSEGNKYDLIIDTGTSLKRVQVKTTTSKSRFGIYKVELRTTGGNQSFNKAVGRQVEDYDILFIMNDKSEVWIIPSDEFTNCNGIHLGKKYSKFKMGR